MVDGPVDKVKDRGILLLMTFSEVGPDTGQPGEGPKLGRNMVTSIASCFLHAPA
jgi:hypothetical protein